MSALMEAQRLESEEGKRIDTINHQLNLLKVKEKEITEVRLCRSKLLLNYKIYAIWCTKHLYSLINKTADCIHKQIQINSILSFEYRSDLQSITVTTK